MSDPTSNPRLNTSRQPAYSAAASSHETSSAPSTMSPRSPPIASLPGVTMIERPQFTNRTDGQSGRLQYTPHPVNIPPINDIQPRYIPDYEAAMQQEQMRMRGAIDANSSMSPVGLNNAGQKRAYRQRRKDPSCDACRERKVKCDATETSSCSECSSRNVKCQFTKETNRRMSSIKQVQDLERQLHETRQELAEIQSQREGQNGSYSSPPTDPTSQPRPAKRRRVGDFVDATNVSRNLRLYGKDIFRTDFRGKWVAPMDLPETSSIQLPPREVTDQCFKVFMDLPVAYPHLDPGIVSSMLDDVYRNWSVSNSKSDTAAIAFGLVAGYGMVPHPKESEKSYHKLLALLRQTSLDLSLDTLRAMILAYISALERNHLSLAYRLIGQAIRGAQELGVNRRSGTISVAESQRCGVWSTLACVEPYITLHLGRPSMFAGEDFGALLEWAAEQLPISRWGSLHVAINNARTVTLIHKSMRQPFMSDLTLATIDENLDRCATYLPTNHLPLSAAGGIRTGSVGALYLEAVRLILHRTRLSTVYGSNTRALGLEACLKYAKNTALILQQLQPEDEEAGEAIENSLQPRAHFALAMGTCMCLHFWRCFLVLVACGNLEAALICARMNAMIGDLRAVVEPCGRYAEWFLQYCLKINKERDRATLVDDTELMAYLTSDMQGNVDLAWAWQDDMDIENSTEHLDLEDDQSQSESKLGAWDRIIGTIQDSLESSEAVAPTPRLEPTVGAVAATQQQSSPTNRISIQDII